MGKSVFKVNLLSREVCAENSKDSENSSGGITEYIQDGY